MRNLKLILLLTISLPALVGCSGENHFPEKLNDDDLTLRKQNFEFTNLSEEYDVKAESFDLYFMENSDVPYISIYDFVYGLDGLFDCGEKMRTIPNNKSIKFGYSYSDEAKYSMEVNWYDDTVTMSSIDFPAAIAKEIESTDYSAHFKNKGGYQTSDNSVTFDLDKYYFQILNYQNTCLMPLVIADILIGAPNYYNIIYNGDGIYGYFGEIDSSDSSYQTIYKSSLNGTSSSKSMREASYNSLCFAMDYFYGLKNERGFSSFNSYISSAYKSQIMSTDASDNLKGYVNALVYQVDDLHTRVDSGSAYNKISETPSYVFDNLGTHWKTFYNTRRNLNSIISKTWTDGEPEVRFYDNSAIIKLSSFITGTHDQIYDKDNKVKADAWKYDSYWYMHYVLDKIVEHGNIDNVLLDLSTNGGGNIGALIRVLGFLTNSDIRYTMYDTLAQRGLIFYYDVDITGDDSYKKDDAYTQFKWTLLTSESSFSAANTFTSIFKELNIGKTIGHKSGGGMCSVLPIVLADGTAFVISSSNSIRQLKQNGFNYDFVAIENGIDVDQEFDYEYFYNDSYLNEVLNKLY